MPILFKLMKIAGKIILIMIIVFNLNTLVTKILILIGKSFKKKKTKLNIN